MHEAFDVIDPGAWIRGENEPGGDEEKRWFRALEGVGRDGHWLFKPRRIKTLKLSSGTSFADVGPERATSLVMGVLYADHLAGRLLGRRWARTVLNDMLRGLYLPPRPQNG